MPNAPTRIDIDIDCTKITFSNNIDNVVHLDLSNLDTSRISNMNSMFYNSPGIISINLSNFNTSNVTDMRYMFLGCSRLEYLDLSYFDITNVTEFTNMFSQCTNLSHIKCKQAFKDWCIANQSNIQLPNTMREGGSGTWEIVD